MPFPGPARRGSQAGLLAGLLLGGIILLGGITLLAGPIAAQEAVSVRTAPVAAFDSQHPEQPRFGPLRFVGGLQIESSDNRFGGLSGVEVSPDGRRVMLINDIGDLFTASIDYTDGVPTGLSNVTLHELIDENGKPFRSKFDSDAESLRAADGLGLSDEGLPNDLLIGFERNHRIIEYQTGANGSPRSAKAHALPKIIGGLPYNKGLEGLAVVPKGAPNAGAIVAFAESSRNADPDTIPGWMLRDDDIRDLGLERSDDFDVTDVIALPNGDLIVLERRFGILIGISMRLRRIRAADLDGPQPMAGETLFTAGMAYVIDNMEGIAVHTDDAGRTILTIVSDDNFSPLQRTLLLQFELLD